MLHQFLLYSKVTLIFLIDIFIISCAYLKCRIFLITRAIKHYYSSVNEFDYEYNLNKFLKLRYKWVLCISSWYHAFFFLFKYTVIFFKAYYHIVKSKIPISHILVFLKLECLTMDV